MRACMRCLCVYAHVGVHVFACVCTCVCVSVCICACLRVSVFEREIEGVCVRERKSVKQIWVCASNKMSKPPSPCCHRACTLSPIEIGKRCSSLVHSKSEQRRTRMLSASTSLSPLSYTTSYLALRPRPCTLTTCACVHEVVCLCMRAHESACNRCMKANESVYERAHALRVFA